MSRGSSAGGSRGSTGTSPGATDRESGRDLPHHVLLAFEHVLALPEPAEGPWGRPGLSPRVQRGLNVAGVAVCLVFAIGWIWSIVNARTLEAHGVAPLTPATASIGAALTHVDARSTAYLTDAALNAYTSRLLASQRGASGKLRATWGPNAGIRADSLPTGAKIEYSRGGEVAPAPTAAGVWNVLLAIGNAARPFSDFTVIALHSFSEKKNGHVGLYYVGTWPSEHGKVGPKKAPPSAYANPAGFIEVTAQNKDMQISEHFKLGDFLTHDQPNVWPKYMVLQQRIVDKLELVLADLEAHGVDTRGVRIMSGFRSPQYNYTGGNTGGRADLSRHMYGDASDIFIDDDGDGRMDDLNHDGKVSIDDARVILAAVDRVEAAHPELIGGAGVYTAASGHGPFIHIDARGYRARWTGTSGG